MNENDLPAWAEAERKTLRADLAAAQKRIAELENNVMLMAAELRMHRRMA